MKGHVKSQVILPMMVYEMLTPEILQKAYARGLFPMADGSGPKSTVSLYETDARAIIVPQSLHVARRLKRLVRQAPFDFRWNDDLRAVMQACNVTRPTRQHWLNADIIDTFAAWNKAYCLSVFQDGERVAGLFGVHLGGAWASADGMFSTVSNAGSVGIVTLVAGLARAGIRMVDLQYGNPYTEKFNLLTISAGEYRAAIGMLAQEKVTLKGDYFDAATGMSFVHSLSQTS